MREARGRCTERAPSWPTGLLGRRPPGPVAALPLLSERSPARARRSPPTFSVRMSGRGRGGSRGVVVRVFPSFPSAARRPSETRARRGSRECGRAGGGLAAGGRDGRTDGRTVGVSPARGALYCSASKTPRFFGACPRGATARTGSPAQSVSLGVRTVCI